MKLKLYIPVVLSVGVTMGLAFAGFNNSISFSKIKSSFFEEEQEDPNEEIEGAIRSIYSLRLNEKTGTLEPEWMQAAVAQADALKLSSRGKGISWENMGPDNVGGRTRCMVFHKDSANIWFVGAVSGGLFRSTTYGQSWTPVNDMQENLNVTCMAQTTDGKIYYGTGEGGFTNLSGTRNGSPAFIGQGLFVNTDPGGSAFKRLPGAFNNGSFNSCNSMCAHPTSNKLYIATESGLFEYDGTANTMKTIRTGGFKEVKMAPNGDLWASNGSGQVVKMDNGTTTATVKNSSIGTGGVTSIGISPDDPNYVYLLGATNTGTMGALYRTTDGGATWTQLVVGNSVTDVFGPNRQGWYDNVISVIPGNKDQVIMGGVDLALWDINKGYIQTGSTFSAPWNSSYVHADKHMIVWNMNTKPATCVIGCDGGIFSSTNLTTWTSINRGYTSLQLYNVASNSLGYLVGGAQDNGTQLVNFKGNSINGKVSKNAFSIYGGDGFDVEFSRYNPNTVFCCTYNGNMVRSGNCGQSTSAFWDTRNDGTLAKDQKTDFNTTFSLWEKDEKTSRFYGAFGGVSFPTAVQGEIWACINATDFSKDPVWFCVAQNLGYGRIVEMDYSMDGDYLWIAKADGLYRVSGLNSANYSTSLYPSPKTIPAGISTDKINISGQSGRTVTSVNVDMADSTHVIVTFGGYGNSTYVYETTNATDATPTWKNITGNLPLMPVYDALVDIDNPKNIILGTDLGIWMTNDGGTTWFESNTGMARVPVFEIRGYEWKPWEGMHVYIGTHGRGYFQSNSLLTSNKNITPNKTTLNVYPNPASEKTTLTFAALRNGNATVQVYDLSGKLVVSQKQSITAGNNAIDLNLTNLNSGYYLAQVVGDVNTKTVKILVK